ncbi:PREDICTED: uncharacterized protein LOC104715146 [Camelina sativa]|uniref:Uncharacterized protein LOC104715146 n=1 Tax=Camelina sativa TaxID=90675 RepID=A0ABM0TT22_CAMSA|nr:PREDICTED: uncharacterized protein LOC104715146 [Camelina sativa]
MIKDCGMLEFPCYGDQLSWRGNRCNNQVIRCRLDRALGNEDWHALYPNSKVEYLEMIGSDHSPILATCLTAVGDVRDNSGLINGGWSALHDAKMDDSVSQEDIRGIERKLKEAYRDEEIYWQQKTSGMEHIATTYFEDLFKNSDGGGIAEMLQAIDPIVTEGYSGDSIPDKVIDRMQYEHWSMLVQFSAF